MSAHQKVQKQQEIKEIENVDRRLTNRYFIPFFVTQFCGALNDNLFKNATVVLFTFYLTQFQTSATSVELSQIATTFFVVPFLLFSAVAGQLCDYYDKSKIAQSIKFFELILVCIGSFGFYTHNHYILLGVVGGLGIHSALFGPVKYAILPQHVTSENLLKANAFVEGGTFLAILIGTIFGGLWANNTLLISIGVICVALMGLITSFYIPSCLPNQKNNNNENHQINHNNINSNKKPPFNLAFIIKGFKEHFTYLWKYPKAGKTIAMISYFWVFGSILLIYFPVIVKDVLHANSDTSTILLALYCIGIGTGSLLCEHFSYGQIKQSFILQGLLGLGISCCLFAFGFPDDNPIVSQRSLAIMGVMEMIHNYPLMLSSLILMGVSSGFFTVPLYTALQKDAPEHIRGGIIATNNMMNSLLMIIGVVLFQQIAKHFDLKLQGVLYINGLIPIVLWLFILAKNSKKLLTV